MPYWSDLSMLVAADVLDSSVKAIPPDLPLSKLRTLYADTPHLDKLPVIDPMSGRLLGTVSKSRVLAAVDFG